jgi:gliding motility-associated-like protein
MYSLVSHAQGEANIWYFGQNAGLDFNTGNPVALNDGQLSTLEGCATICNSSGQLLFYTDGTTIWNSIHQIMPNGTGLFGHPSSTHSATIVPLPGSSTLFYVFTLDAFVGINGFCYSIVDMSLNGGLGAVTVKNIQLYTPSNEKLSVVKHANDIDFWVVTRQWNSNNFVAYLLTSGGLSTTPIISSAGAVISGSTNNVLGQMKISPDGSKLALCNLHDNVELYDFNTNTGVVSNAIQIYNTDKSYGVEFSPNSQLLYVSNSNQLIHVYKILQFDVNAPDVPSSLQTIYTTNEAYAQIWAMQLGPDGKIYAAEAEKMSLAVIQNPNQVGIGCNFQPNAINLAGRTCKLGLPPFVSSFLFNAAFQLQNTCVGVPATFQLNNSAITDAVWNFGDGTTSTVLNPSHTYNNPGTFTVSVTVTTPNGTGTNTREIVIYPLPTLLNNSVTLKQCDDDNDGFSAFNLTEVNALLVNTTAGLIITYHPTLQDAKDNTAAISNTTNYTNQTVSNQTLFARVENANGCYSTAQINLQVSTTLIPAAFQKVFNKCDDAVSGSNTDGIATFNFSSVTPQIEDLYPTGQLLDITYYRNLTDALAEQNAITDIANYTNTDYPVTQNIYVRVDSQVNNECLGLGHHITLTVEPLPIVEPQLLKECDDNHDGIFAFDTTNLETQLLNGLTDVNVFYFDENGVSLPSPLPNPFVTTSQTINVTVKNNFGKQCEYGTTITFVVDDLPEAFPIPTTLTSLCDDEIDPALQDGAVPFDTSTFQSTILGNQTGVEVSYFDQNNVPLSSPLPNPFVSGSQTIRVELKNPLNPTCFTTYNISLIVHPNPSISLIGNELICSDNPAFIKIIDAGLTDPSLQNEYTYTWFLDNVLVPNQTNYTLTVNQEGAYTVIVENQLGCTSSRTIEVTASNSATIENIVVTDLSDNNSITVKVSGLGEYVYNLNGVTFQESEVFSGLIPGIYTIGIADEKGCKSVYETVYILGAPKYFSPNGDSYNDFWNIQFLDPTLNLKISIFDRFGKLLKLFNPKDTGWDGTYNGTPLPATDYWYVIAFESGRFVRGHFSLVR